MSFKHLAWFILLSVMLIAVVAYKYYSPGRMDSLVIPGSVDFGEVGMGKHERPVEIWNPTTRPIVIKRAVASCGCTILELNLPVVVAPGQRISTKILFDATGKSGQISKKLTFHTDAVRETPNGSKSITLLTKLSAVVVNPPQPVLLPSIIDFGKLGTWEGAERSVELYGAMMEPGQQTIEGLLQFEALGKDDSSNVIMVTLLPDNKGGEFRIHHQLETSTGKVGIEIHGWRFDSLFTKQAVLVLQQPIGSYVQKSLSIFFPPGTDISDLVLYSNEFSIQGIDVASDSDSAATISFQVAQLKKDFSSGSLVIRQRSGTECHVQLYSIPIAEGEL